MRIARELFGVAGLRDNVVDLAVSSEQTVKNLLRQLDGGRTRLRRGEFHFDQVRGVAVEVFKPRLATNQPGLDAAKRVEPGFQGLLFELPAKSAYK